MKHHLVQLAVCAASLLALPASPVHADLITGSVQWNSGLSTPKVYANGGVDATDAPPGIAFRDWSSWTFSNLLLPKTGSIPGNTITGDLEVFGLEKGEPAHFGNNGKGTPFKLTFDVRDGSALGEVSFSGLLYGTPTKDGHGNETSSVRIDWLGPTDKAVDLNHHVYDLTISDLIRKGSFAETDGLGQISVGVRVTHNPEPASLVLAAIAVPALGLTWLRKKWRAAPAE